MVVGTSNCFVKRELVRNRLSDPTMYVSAVPTNTAVGFYRSRGCELAAEVHPALYAKEPEDVHLVCAISPTS